MNGTPYFAHSANPSGIWHRLSDHLHAVAAKAHALAGPAPWADEATLAGGLHDLAKYGDLFQGRLRRPGATYAARRLPHRARRPTQLGLGSS